MTLGLQLVSFFVLARLLTPGDIGLYSVATALIGIAQVLREFGVSSYLVQEKELTREHVRTAFTISLALSVLLCLGILAIARSAALFYREPRLESVVQVLALSFLLIPFSSTALALLTRDMKFRALFWISTTSSLISQLVALAFAAVGYGYWSLVWSSLVATIVSSVGAAVAARGGFAHRLSLSKWRAVAAFGGQSVTGRIVAELSLSFNDLVAGRILGLADVGILSRGQGVMNLLHRDLIGAIRSVAFPAFAQGLRHGENLERLHAKFVANVAAFGWPFYGFMAMFPLEALRLMFGPQWDAAAPLVPIFCGAGAVAVLWSFVGSLLTASGKVGQTMRMELVIQPVRLAILLWCALAYRSLEAFAWALLIVYSVQVLVAYSFKERTVPTDVRRLVAALRPSILLAVISLAPAATARAVVAFMGIAVDSAAMGLLLVLTCLAWMGGILWLKHPLLDDPLVARARKLLPSGA